MIPAHALVIQLNGIALFPPDRQRRGHVGEFVPAIRPVYYAKCNKCHGIDARGRIFLSARRSSVVLFYYIFRNWEYGGNDKAREMLKPK